MNVNQATMVALDQYVQKVSKLEQDNLKLLTALSQLVAAIAVTPLRTLSNEPNAMDYIHRIEEKQAEALFALARLGE